MPCSISAFRGKTPTQSEPLVSICGLPSRPIRVAMAECGASLFATHLDEAMHWYREAARGEVMAL